MLAIQKIMCQQPYDILDLCLLPLQGHPMGSFVFMFLLVNKDLFASEQRLLTLKLVLNLNGNHFLLSICPLFRSEISLYLVHSVHILHIKYATYCSALMFLYLKHNNKQSTIFSGHFNNFPCICEGLTQRSLMLTLTCFIIDYHGSNNTLFLLCRCVQPSKYCRWVNI